MRSYCDFFLFYSFDNGYCVLEGSLLRNFCVGLLTFAGCVYASQNLTSLTVLQIVCFNNPDDNNKIFVRGEEEEGDVQTSVCGYKLCTQIFYI